MTEALSSPLRYSSPRSFLLQDDNNQRVPGSPGLSPLYGHGRPGPPRRTPHSAASPVPDVYTGSPLLRQILRAGLQGKRGRETDPLSPSSPRNGNKRARMSPLVPSVITRLSTQPTPNQEQVVPNCSSPLSAKLEDGQYKRKLPEVKNGVKPLDLFNGDDIFAASHEE